MRGRNQPLALSLGLCAGFLAIGLFLWIFSIQERRTTRYFIEVTTQNLHDELEILNLELEAYQAGSSSITDLAYPTFIYENDQVSKWSDFRIVPPFNSVNKGPGLSYIELPQGKFLKSLTRLDDGRVLVQLLELYSTPPFTNQYVRSRFNRSIFPQATISVDEVDAEDTNISSPKGEALFGAKFDLEANVVQGEVQAFIAALILIGLFFAFIYLNSWAWFLAEKDRVWTGIAGLVIGLLGGRILMLYLSFPFSVYPLDLFDPRFYASSIFNPSLGDLLINMLFILSLSSFLFRYVLREDLGKGFSPDRKVSRTAILVAINTLGLLVLSFHYGLLENILVNSQIEIDINKSLQFTSFRIVTLVIFFISTVIWFQTSHFVYSISISATEKWQDWVIVYLISCALFALTGWLMSLQVGFILVAQSVYFILLFKYKLPEFLAKLSYSTLFYFFAASILSSVVGTIAIYEYHEYEELIDKQHFANDLLIENDLKGEYLINESIPQIQDDVFINSRLLSRQVSKSQIEQKIRNDYLGNYFDKYDLEVRLYDAEGLSLTNEFEDSVLLEIKTELATNPLFETDYPELYFIGHGTDDKPKRYLRSIEISRYDNLVGYLVLDLRLKKVIPQTVYPELLVDSRFIDNHKSFDYAVYTESELSYKTGSFNYENLFETEFFDIPRLYVKGMERGGFHHYGVRSAGDRVLVITSSVYPTSFMISNFSFIFISIVMGVLVLLLIRTIAFSRSMKLNFGAKIQLYLNLAFFVPLVIISVVIINRLNTSYQEEINRSTIKKINVLRDQIVSSVDDYLSNKINRETLAHELNDLARYSQTDLTLYGTDGRLIASSQPLIFTNNLLSTLINPNAFQEISIHDKDHLILNESVGGLAYKSSYAAVKSFETGRLLGLLGLPFFGSKNHLERQTVEAFTSILNIFTIVLIASLFVSNLASRLLTHPLNLLTQKIRKTSLAAHNEPLQWKGNDEIGMVVSEYNKMLVNLEESKEALAKSQKESAWREIAKQVAHEIKNPLTPMKLSLQHLKRILPGRGNGESEFDKPIDNLLHQVDTLSDIATSFSAFAKMPIPQNEPFELCGEVRRIVELFDNENVNLKVEITSDKVMVNGDQKLMGRIISNLIINGMQSMEDKSIPEVEVRVHADERKVTIEVQDYGAGIPEEIHNKVFIPNFSTKESGSGIGLAVAKRGIEHAGGSIWFETEQGKGTTFFVSLPLVT